MSARDTILLALTRYYQANADPRGTAAQVLTGYDAARRAETLNERTDARDRMCRDAHTAGRTAALTEGARLLEDAACDADWNRPADYCRGLRAGAELLLAKVAETGTVTAAGPEFFQRGHTYLHTRLGWKFRCDAVTSHPDTGKRVAAGYSHFGHGKWQTGDLSEGIWTEGGWDDVTEAGDGS